MLQTRRSTLRLAQKTRLRPQRRHETTKATTSHAASAGHAGPPHSSHHPEPVNEPLGVRPLLLLTPNPYNQLL